jgi:hypothetical protein
MPVSATPAPPEGVVIGRRGPRTSGIVPLGYLFPLVWLGWPLVCIGWALASGNGGSFFVPLLVPILAYAIGVKLLAAWAIRRDNEEVLRAGYRLCTACRYDLSESVPEGLCPECGAAYTHDGLARSWKWTIECHQQSGSNA